MGLSTDDLRKLELILLKNPQAGDVIQGTGGARKLRIRLEGKASSASFARKQSLPSVNVFEIRKSLSMTQKAFASVLGVSSRTVEAWESGKTTPTPTAKKLIHLISQDHTLVDKLM